MNSNDIFFFIGTEAELIKLFPVMLELQRRELSFHIIASGQNDIKNSSILHKSGCGEVELELSEEKSIRKNAPGLLKWWFQTYRGSAGIIRNKYSHANLKHSYMIVHGDTISTYMGARIGDKLGMTVCHIEAGLRSHNLLNPFPEEIDRLLTSRVARVHFAPGDYAAFNLRKARGEVINTRMNTLMDSLAFSEGIPAGETVRAFLDRCDDYFVFVIHRQENVSNSDFFIDILNTIKEISKNRHCLFILHEITRRKLEALGEMESLVKDCRFTLMPRVQYFDFMKLLNHSEFVITDGGSNQEELFYMGKPCMIIRKSTERKEGLGGNAVLLKKGRSEKLKEFAEKYKSYEKAAVNRSESPSGIIADYFC